MWDIYVFGISLSRLLRFCWSYNTKFRVRLLCLFRWTIWTMLGRGGSSTPRQSQRGKKRSASNHLLISGSLGDSSDDGVEAPGALVQRMAVYCFLYMPILFRCRWSVQYSHPSQVDFSAPLFVKRRWNPTMRLQTGTIHWIWPQKFWTSLVEWVDWRILNGAGMKIFYQVRGERKRIQYSPIPLQAQVGVVDDQDWMVQFHPQWKWDTRNFRSTSQSPTWASPSSSSMRMCLKSKMWLQWW